MPYAWQSISADHSQNLGKVFLGTLYSQHPNLLATCKFCPKTTYFAAHFLVELHRVLKMRNRDPQLLSGKVKGVIKLSENPVFFGFFYPKDPEF